MVQIKKQHEEDGVMRERLMSGMIRAGSSEIRASKRSR